MLQTTDDRQKTDRRQTDGRRHTANMNLSSRSLIKLKRNIFLFHERAVKHFLSPSLKNLGKGDKIYQVQPRTKPLMYLAGSPLRELGQDLSDG